MKQDVALQYTRVQSWQHVAWRLRINRRGRRSTLQGPKPPLKEPSIVYRMKHTLRSLFIVPATKRGAGELRAYHLAGPELPLLAISPRPLAARPNDIGMNELVLTNKLYYSGVYTFFFYYFFIKYDFNFRFIRFFPLESRSFVVGKEKN